MDMNNRRDFLKKVGLTGLVSSLVFGVSSKSFGEEIKKVETQEIPLPIKPGVYNTKGLIIHVTDKMVHISKNGMDYYAYENGAESLSNGDGIKITYKDLLNYSGRDVRGVIDIIDIFSEITGEHITLKRDKKNSDSFSSELLYESQRGGVNTENLGDNYAGWFETAGTTLKEKRNEFKEYIPFEKILLKSLSSRIRDKEIMKMGDPTERYRGSGRIP